jgi:hypothetical protein
MFQSIAYYHLLPSDEVVVTKNWLRATGWGHGFNIPERILTHPYFCIVPEALGHYSSWITEKEYLRGDGLPFNEETWTRELEEEKPLIPVEQLIEQFQFIRLQTAEDAPDQFLITERFNTRELMQFWFGRNHFTDLNQWRDLGLTEKIFNLLPDHSNYYDRNIICTCGGAGCNNQEVWYIKHSDSYTVPFVIDTDTRLYVDMYALCREGRKWEPEEYIEDTFRNRDRYSHFPFCFEARDFELFNKTLLANGGLIAEYGRESA